MSGISTKRSGRVAKQVQPPWVAESSENLKCEVLSWGVLFSIRDFAQVCLSPEELRKIAASH